MPRDPWRELEELLRRPPEDVVGQLELLLPRLGLDPAEVLTGDDDGLARHRPMVKARKERRRAELAFEAEERALMAAEDLRRRAIHGDGVVHLDHQLVLGDLARHATAELIAFEAFETEVIVLRRLLRDARTALRPFPDVCCFLDARALRLRWRGGRGGLDLAYGYALGTQARRALFRVPLAPLPLPPPPPARPRPPVRLSDVLSDLGLIP